MSNISATYLGNLQMELVHNLSGTKIYTTPTPDHVQPLLAQNRGIGGQPFAGSGGKLFQQGRIVGAANIVNAHGVGELVHKADISGVQTDAPRAAHVVGNGAVAEGVGPAAVEGEGAEGTSAAFVQVGVGQAL